MHYPEYGEYAKVPSIAPAYLDAVATVERSLVVPEQPQRMGSIRIASHLIGKQCMQLQDDPQSDRSTFLRAGIIMSKPEARRANLTPAALLMRDIAQLGTMPDKVFVEAVRKEAHAKIINSLGQVTQRLRTTAEYSKIKQNEDIGSFAELATIGMITRLKHPRFMAFPALPHHDASTRREGNYDLLAVEVNEAGEAEHHKVQIKSGCLGFCEYVSPRTQSKRYKIIEERRKEARAYDSDIAIISTHCDLSINSPSKFSVADLLIKEFAGEATGEEIDQLDFYSNTLQLVITSPDRLHRQ